MREISNDVDACIGMRNRSRLTVNLFDSRMLWQCNVVLYGTRMVQRKLAIMLAVYVLLELHRIPGPT